MKQLATYAMLLFLCFGSIKGFSQGTSTKPKQFSSFPDVINCPNETLNRIFNSPAGQNISLSFPGNFTFNGNITSNVVRYSNLQSAVIKSPYFDNTIFSVSKIINADNSITYTGRIINRNYFDGYELRRDAAGNYQLIKIETDRVIPECRLQ